VTVSAQAAEPALRPAGARSVGVRRFAALVLHLTVRELRSTNHLTFLGWGWPVVRQLAQLAVLVFVFGHVFDFDIENYAVYVFVGLVAWTWFATGIASASSAVLQRRYLVLQPRLPTAVVPLVAVAVPFVDVLFALPVLVIMLLVTTGLTWGLLVCPLLIAVQLVLMAGLAWLLAAVSVFLRDVPNLVGVVLLMLFYLTPVFYVRDSVPEQFRWVLDINPLATIIEAYRSLLLGGPGPGAGLVAVLVGLSGVLAVVGFVVFRRLQPSFADHL
jgi:lipopolysaccharide transport system permease protein